MPAHNSIENLAAAGPRAFNNQTGTTYTLALTDAGKIVKCTNGSAITVTLPKTFPIGFSCTLVQGGAGTVTVSAASGATLRSRGSLASINGQYGVASITVITNSTGIAAEWLFAGDRV